MLRPEEVKPGDFVRHMASGVNEGAWVMKVVLVSGHGDLVVEHLNGGLTVCKANELQAADGQPLQKSAESDDEAA
jgi:hypothetical protein